MFRGGIERGETGHETRLSFSLHGEGERRDSWSRPFVGSRSSGGGALSWMHALVTPEHALKMLYGFEKGLYRPVLKHGPRSLTYVRA